MNIFAIIAIAGAILIAAGFIGILVNMAGLVKSGGNHERFVAGFGRHVYGMIAVACGMFMVAGSGITWAVQLLQKNFG